MDIPERVKDWPTTEVHSFLMRSGLIHRYHVRRVLRWAYVSGELNGTMVDLVCRIRDDRAPTGLGWKSRLEILVDLLRESVKYVTDPEAPEWVWECLS